MPRHIFLSYAREDIELMRRLRADLRARDFATWDDEFLKPGTRNWKRATARAIEAAGALVVILSPEAKQSRWVREELDYADAQQVRVFPVFARGDRTNAVPFGLAAAQEVDIRQPASYQAKVQELADAIDEHLAELEAQEAARARAAEEERLRQLAEAKTVSHPAPRFGLALARLGVKPLWAGGAALAAALLVGVLTLAAVSRDRAQPEPAVRPAPTTTPALVETETAAEAEAETETALPPGFAPVISNAQWTPVVQDFGGVPMALVPAGCFVMGSKSGSGDEQPVHQQCFDRPFWIDVTEVTNSQYGSPAGNCLKWSSADDQPRICVNWFEATVHCESRGARLPTEAEWEYAARGPSGLAYPWGNDFVASNVVYAGNSGGQTAKVGNRPDGVSWVGALDMSGNVWEWVSSIYAPYPYDAGDGREAGPGSDSRSTRGLRGGSWLDAKSAVRAAVRSKDLPDIIYNSRGFRCARSF